MQHKVVVAMLTGAALHAARCVSYVCRMDAGV